MAGKPTDPGDSILRSQAAYTRASKLKKKKVEAMKAQIRQELNHKWKQDQDSNQHK